MWTPGYNFPLFFGYPIDMLIFGVRRLRKDEGGDNASCHGHQSISFLFWGVGRGVPVYMPEYCISY